MLAKNFIIATDVGDTRYMVKEDFAYLMKDNSSNEIFNGIEYFMSLNRDEQFKKMNLASEFILKNFTIEKFTEYFINIHNVK